MLCCKDEALLLVLIDTCGSAAKFAAAALTDLRKYQCFSFAQDQVDLAKTAAVVGLNQLQTVPLQKLRSEQLGLSAGFC